MFPEDRVLVGVMPDPADLEIVQTRQWYRIPAKNAPRTGIEAEVLAFYLTRKFPENMRYSIPYYARRTGHELVRRVDLLPDQPDHPRADEQYYMIQLGPLKKKDPPIVSVRWRRITFIQTTWDRFVSAREVNDLYSTDKQFVDRVYHTLKNRGIQPDRNVEIKEKGRRFDVDILIPCRDGAVMLSSSDDKPSYSIRLTGEDTTDNRRIEEAIRKHGGPLMVDMPF